MSYLVTVAKERNFRHFSKLVQEKSGVDNPACREFGGKRIRLQKGISRLRSRLSIHPLVRRDVACNVSVRIINGYVGDVARYVSTGWWHRERLERNVSDVGSPLFFSLCGS